MSTIYLAGPISLGGSLSPDAIARNVAVFKEEAAFWRRLGWAVLDPTDHFGGDQTLPYQDYMRAALHALLQARAVRFLPGWERSAGARFERQVAEFLQLRIFEPDSARCYHLATVGP